jgi:hypothetical protein
MAKSDKKFLQELQKQAKLQSKLEVTRFFPKPLDPLMSFIGNYPWQFLLISSAVSAVIWRMTQLLP